MMLRTSSNSINPALNLTFFTVRKNIGILVLSIVAVLMLCPGFYLVRMDEYATYSVDLVWVLAALLTVGAGILAVFYNIINFLFLYSKKSSDVFHALPLTRFELLLSRWAAGIITTLIPVIIGYVSLAVIFLFLPLHRGDIGMVFGCMAYTVMTVLVCSAFSMIFVVCAGSAFDLILSFLGVNLGLLAVGLVVMSMMNERLIGASSSVDYSIFETLSPFWYCGSGLVEYIDNDCTFNSDSIWYFVRTAVYTVVSIVSALLLYNRRKAERGGDAYAYRFIYIIASFVVGIAAAYLIGYIFASRGSGIVFWLFAILGALIFASAFGAITDRGFKYFKRSLIVGASSAVTLGLVAVIFVTGAFGYSSRIPDKSSIESVVVRYNGEDVVYTDVDLPLEVHKAIVDRMDVIRDKENDALYPEKSYLYYTYNLKGGLQMKRTYLLPIDGFAEELYKLYTSDERLDTILQFLKTSTPTSVEFSGYINTIDTEGRFESDDGEGFGNVYMTPAETAALIEAYREDIQNTDVSIITDSGYDKQIMISWSDSREENRYLNYYYHLKVEDNFENTLSYLKSLELSKRIEAAEYEQYKK